MHLPCLDMSWMLDHGANVIESNERSWADKCCRTPLLPMPNEEDKEKLASYGVVIGKQHEYCQQLYHVTFPSHLVVQHSRNSKGDARHLELFDTQTQKGIATIFVKI